MSTRTSKLSALVLWCFVVVVSFLILTSVSNAQTPAEQEFHEYYKDPKPERLIGYVERYEGKIPKDNWSAYPPLAGFLAGVFRAHPDKIERLVPAQLNPRSADTIAAALQLSGNASMVAKLKPKLAQAGSDERLKAAFVSLPSRIEDLRIRSPTDLDLLWGATFATGDVRFVNMIIDYFAKTANRSEPIAMDVAKVTIAHMGGPKDVLKELKGKYGEPLTIEIVFASSALWAVLANARQHSFVQAAVTTYMQNNPGSFATKVFSMMRPKPR